MLPRFCDQTLERSRKADLYQGGTPGWIAKLDTVVHELYHIDPDETGIRRVARADGTHSPRSHGPVSTRKSPRWCRAIWRLGPDPALYDFLEHDFAGLSERYGGVVGDDVQEFPVVPAALHGGARCSAADPEIRSSR